MLKLSRPLTLFVAAAAVLPLTACAHGGKKGADTAYVARDVSSLYTAAKKSMDNGDYDQAAQLFGSVTGLKSQLMHGRRRFRALWHEGEAPSAHWGCDRRAGSTRGTVGKGESAVYNLRRRQRAAARKQTAA